MTNSSCFASQRDGSINRSRKKVWRNKRSSLRKCAFGVDFGFGKRQIGHFHEVNSIRLPITSLPAYALLTIVCFFSALPESTVVLTAGEKSSSPLPARIWSRIRECHEILDLVGPSLHSRRVLHAPFVALSRTIHGTIALIFPSPRDLLKATAIAEAVRTRRDHLSRRTPFKAIRSITRRVKRAELAYFQTK